MFRYQYTATIMAKGGTNENGDPINGESVAFSCDYQPSSSKAIINVAGVSVPIEYILFVPKSCMVSFQKGNDVECNGDMGEVVLSVPYKFGRMVYVKGKA